MKIALNLGCGNDYIHSTKEKKWINVDDFTDFPGAKVDKKVNLNKIPYPFPAGYADEVKMSHVLEHLKEPRLVLREVHRVMKKGGVFRLNVPHFTRGYSVHVHEHGFSLWSVLEDTRGLFKAERAEFVWDYPETFRRGSFILKPFCRFWNWILNRNHWFTERFLCYKFGGIMEARFVLRKI